MVVHSCIATRALTELNRHVSQGPSSSLEALLQGMGSGSIAAPPNPAQPPLPPTSPMAGMPGGLAAAAAAALAAQQMIRQNMQSPVWPFQGPSQNRPPLPPGLHMALAAATNGPPLSALWPLMQQQGSATPWTMPAPLQQPQAHMQQQQQQQQDQPKQQQDEQNGHQQRARQQQQREGAGSLPSPASGVAGIASAEQFAAWLQTLGSGVPPPMGPDSECCCNLTVILKLARNCTVLCANQVVTVCLHTTHTMLLGQVVLMGNAFDCCVLQHIMQAQAGTLQKIQRHINDAAANHHPHTIPTHRRLNALACAGSPVVLPPPLSLNLWPHETHMSMPSTLLQPAALPQGTAMGSQPAPAMAPGVSSLPPFLQTLLAAGLPLGPAAAAAAVAAQGSNVPAHPTQAMGDAAAHGSVEQLMALERARLQQQHGQVAAQQFPAAPAYTQASAAQPLVAEAAQLQRAGTMMSCTAEVCEPLPIRARKKQQE